MAGSQSGLKALHRIDGYLPIEDYGLAGDGATAALIGRDNVVAWLCLPRFDSRPLFCNLGLSESRPTTCVIPGNIFRQARAPEIHPTTGTFPGSYPQTFSHIWVMSSGVNWARLSEKSGRTD